MCYVFERKHFSLSRRWSVVAARFSSPFINNFKALSSRRFFFSSRLLRGLFFSVIFYVFARTYIWTTH
jgi:hypothetical protein